MLKKTGLLLLILCLFGIVIYAIMLSDDQADDEGKTRTVEGIASGDGIPAVDEESATMALKAMELVQGENGKMTWRLRTTGALMRRQDGNIEVTDPRLTYFMQPDDNELFVQADFGDIFQTDNKFRFVRNVFITNEDRAVAGDLLEYDGTTRIMTMPNASHFSSPDLQGSASRVIWRMDDSAIESIGNVNVFFKSGAKLAPSETQEPPSPGEGGSAPAAP